MSALRNLLREARDRARKIRKDAQWAVRRQQVARAMEPIPGLPAPADLEGAIIFFVPYAGVSPMISQTCVVARTLKERGHRVYVVRCFELFDGRDEAAVELARSRWRSYREAGHDVKYWQQDPGGAWQQKGAG